MTDKLKALAASIYEKSNQHPPGNERKRCRDRLVAKVPKEDRWKVKAYIAQLCQRDRPKPAWNQRLTMSRKT